MIFRGDKLIIPILRGRIKNLPLCISALSTMITIAIYGVFVWNPLFFTYRDKKTFLKIKQNVTIGLINVLISCIAIFIGKTLKKTAK